MKIVDSNLNKWSAKPLVAKITSREFRQILLLCGNSLTEINFGGDIDFQNSMQIHLDIKADKDFFSLITENCTSLQSLQVSGLIVTSGGMEVLTNNCSNITKFSIGDCMNDVQENFSKFLKNATRLHFLGLSGTDITNKCFLNTSTKFIEILKLYKFNDHYYQSPLRETFFLRNVGFFTFCKSFSIKNIFECAELFAFYRFCSALVVYTL